MLGCEVTLLIYQQNWLDFKKISRPGAICPSSKMHVCASFGRLCFWLYSFSQGPYSLWVTNHMNNAAHVQTAASPTPKHTEVCLWRESWDLEVTACFIYFLFFKYRCMLLIIREKVARLALVRWTETWGLLLQVRRMSNTQAEMQHTVFPHKKTNHLIFLIFFFFYSSWNT